MSDYTVKSGQNLWNIIKDQFHLTSSAEISKKVNEIAKANHIKNPNSIFAGQKLDLGNVGLAVEKSSKSSGTEPAQVVVDKASGPHSSEAPVEKTVPQDAKTQPKENIAEKFNNWQNKVGMNDSSADSEFKFTSAEYTNDVQNNGGKNAKSLYMQSLEALSKDSVARYDKNNDGQIDFNELKQKEFEDLKKANPGVDIDEKDVEQPLKTAFKVKDINGDGKISLDEEETYYAAMDQDKDGNINGRITKNEVTGMSSAVTQEKYSEALQKKFKTMHNFLFEQK